MNSSKWIVDSQLWIKAFDVGANAAPDDRKRAAELIRKHLEIGEIFLTPTVIYEVMRGVKSEYRDSLLTILKKYLCLDIRFKHGEEASKLYIKVQQHKQENEANINVDKHSFDILHAATAHCEEMELLSWDKDYKKLAELLTH